MRRAARRDANHAALVAELRARAYEVDDLGHVGGSVPDLVVSNDTQTKLVEVKNPSARGGRKRGAVQAASLDRQAAFRARHPGVVVATTAEEVDLAFAASHPVRGGGRALDSEAPRARTPTDDARETA